MFVCLFYSELVDPRGRTSESHEKGPLLWDPNLISAFGIIVAFADLVAAPGNSLPECG